MCIWPLRGNVHRDIEQPFGNRHPTEKNNICGVLWHQEHENDE